MFGLHPQWGPYIGRKTSKSLALSFLNSKRKCTKPLPLSFSPLLHPHPSCASHLPRGNSSQLTWTVTPFSSIWSWPSSLISLREFYLCFWSNLFLLLPIRFHSISDSSFFYLSCLTDLHLYLYRGRQIERYTLLYIIHTERQREKERKRDYICV